MLLSLPFLALVLLSPIATAADQEPLNVLDVHTSESWNYVDCGSPEDAIQIKSIVISPDPPKPGKDLTVTVEADVLEQIEDGASADVTVKLGLIKILSKSFDVCEEARNANASVQCPVEEGSYTVQQTVSLPKEIPPSKITVNVRGYTADEDDMLCLDLTVDFIKRPFFKKLGW